MGETQSVGVVTVRTFHFHTIQNEAALFSALSPEGHILSSNLLRLDRTPTPKLLPTPPVSHSHFLHLPKKSSGTQQPHRALLSYTLPHSHSATFAQSSTRNRRVNFTIFLFIIVVRVVIFLHHHPLDLPNSATGKASPYHMQDHRSLAINTRAFGGLLSQLLRLRVTQIVDHLHHIHSACHPHLVQIMSPLLNRPPPRD